MQISIEMKNLLCKLEQNNYTLIIFFMLGYLIFSLINKKTNTITEEEKARKYRKSIKYLNKHLKENEEFFMGNTEAETSN